MEAAISLAVQALCTVTQLAGFGPFVVVLFACVVSLDLRLMFDVESSEVEQPRQLGVVCLLVWAWWLGYLFILPDVDPIRAVVYTPSVLVMTRLSIKHSSKKLIFAVIMVLLAFVMQKIATPRYAVAGQGFAFTGFAHVLFFRRVSQKEPPSLIWIVVSSVWILLCPWFIVIPLSVAVGVIVTRQTLLLLKQFGDEDVENPKLDASN
jgi:hypothetical protein